MRPQAELATPPHPSRKMLSGPGPGQGAADPENVWSSDTSQPGGERRGKVDALPPPREDSPQSFIRQAAVSSGRQ